MMRLLQILTLGLLLTAFLSPQITFATEGTCSWHGGVSCNAGADWDGSTICKDGWRDSSERFYSQQVCTKELYYCSQAEASRLNFKYRLDELYQVVSQKCAIPPELLVSSGDTASQSREKAIKSLELSSQCNSAQGDYNLASNQYDRECYSIGESEYYQRMAEFLAKYQQSQVTQKATCPSNLVVSGGQCVCPSDLVYNGSSCVTATQSCQSKLGPNSYGDSKQCYCSSGYSYDSITASCVQFGTQITKDEQCKKLGFGDWYNTEKQSCDVCPAGTTKDPKANKCFTPPVSIVPSTIPAPVEPRTAPLPPSKPKEVIKEKPVVVIPEPTLAESRPTTTEQVSQTIEATPPQQITPPAPEPKPKPLWSRIINWFKFW